MILHVADHQNPSRTPLWVTASPSWHWIWGQLHHRPFSKQLYWNKIAALIIIIYHKALFHLVWANMNSSSTLTLCDLNQTEPLVSLSTPAFMLFFVQMAVMEQGFERSLVNYRVGTLRQIIISAHIKHLWAIRTRKLIWPANLCSVGEPWSRKPFL